MPTAFFVPPAPPAGSSPKAKKGQEMQNQDLQPREITPALYQLGTVKFPVYLSLGREAMLIEGGTGPSASIIVQQLQMLGIDPSRIRYLALTHTHADHIGALPRLRRLWPHLLVIAGPQAAATLASENLLEQFLPADRMLGNIFLQNGLIRELPAPLETYCFDVDWIVQDGEVIDLGGGVAWQALHTPGHCPGHVSYYDAKQGLMALGDMTGYYDPQEDVLWPNYFSSLPDYCASLRRMKEMPARLGLLSHNGAVDLAGGSYLEWALAATMDYHWEMLHRLGRGEDPESMCRQKAQWVFSVAPIASLKAINFLCKALLRQSRAAEVLEREKRSAVGGRR
jgi:glyoxylase-like metal-dependent hydrolase (beta-lactamase superfamily II)